MPTAKKRMINAQDLYQINVLEDPQWSPDGHEAAFVRLTADKAGNTNKRAIWRWRLEWEEPRQFTAGGKFDMMPRYSPDGEQMAFLSNRGGKPQVFMIRLDGGEARQLTRLPNGVNGFSWSPDGKRMAFLSSVNADERRLEKAGKYPLPPPEDEKTGKVREIEQEYEEKARVDPRVYRGLPFKQGTDFVSDRYSHIYLLNVEDKEAKPTRLTDGDADFSLPAWSIDGHYLWCSSVRKPTQIRNAESDIVRITVRDGTIKRMPRPGHYGAAPKPSPDGKWLAAITTLESGNFGHIARLTVFKPSGTGWRDLNLEIDRAVGTNRYIPQFYWAADSTGLYCTIEDQGSSRIFFVDLEKGNFKLVCGGDELIQEIAVNRSGELVFTSRNAVHPPELYTFTPGGQPERRTKFHDDWLAGIQLAKTEEICYHAPDGQEIQGWLVKPPDFNPKQKWPLVLNVHGGPHVMWTPATHAMWLEWQLHAARGYVVFYCNPRGSDGYGSAFASAIHDNWGKADMADILSGVDTVVAKGYIDTERMAVTGGSYGGFMTAWIIGHDRRFAAAVSQRGVYQLLSFYGTTDVPMLIEREFDVLAFDDPQKMWEYSPLAYVRQMRTPLLILHSDNDYRVPIADAEQLFTALKKLRRTVEFVRYPREGHELSRSGEPRHRIDRLERMTAWFDKYCKPRKVS